MFIVFIAGLPRKPKPPFTDWYSTYAHSFSKAACSFPTWKNCALLPIALAIPQKVQSRFAISTSAPINYMPLDTARFLARIVAFFHGGIRVLHTLRINNQESGFFMASLLATCCGHLIFLMLPQGG
ncbi:hypothetical protein HMPREF9080_02750 [Cardiobacterium valvarum F0432]|uniref:Uncharacterized protein n=1 Tax=Cardiobacterium valvarum F0432 TaxID=797473 RepID=G9ZIY2_9GAMM|nr:hypothetical protein HMPREF9080_02750 [Cardiobacterium valvarum F0432]